MANGKKTGGRKPGSPNLNTLEKRNARESFFASIVDDKREHELWEHFMTAPEPNVINWQAFKRAVEYKRGMPIQQHSGPDGGAIPVQFVTNVTVPDANDKA